MNSISVAMPIHRFDRHLALAIRSVLDQDFRDFEFLIAVNGDAPGLEDEALRLTAGDSRVRIHRLELGQLAFALNYLAEKATGEWIVRMDGDDVCRTDRLSKLRQLMAQSNVDVIGSWATVIDAHGRTIGQLRPPLNNRAIRRRRWMGAQLIHPSVAFRRSFWLRMRGYLGGFATEDTDLWMRAAHTGAVFANIPEPLIDYRIHANQAARTLKSYAEVAGHWYREMLEHPSIISLAGLSLATMKVLIRRLGLHVGRTDAMLRRSMRRSA